jgi:ssDNA-binding Zn-finger/Zn-ribbon topoisomerase 1
MSKSQVKVKCPECGNDIVFARAKNAELTIHRKTIKECHNIIASLVEAGKAEKVRRDTIESDLRVEIRKLQDEIRYIQENRQP